MVWEKFTRVGKSFKPKISIRGNSQIGLNFASIEAFKLNDYQFAVLYFDKENKKVGIKLTNSKDEDGVCRLRVRGKAGASISARSYIDCYKLNNLKKHRFNAKWDTDSKEKMIVADLKEE